MRRARHARAVALLFAALAAGCMAPHSGRMMARPLPPAPVLTQPLDASPPVMHAGPLSDIERASSWDTEAVLQLVNARSPAILAAAASVEEARGRLTEAGLYPNPDLGVEYEDAPLSPKDLDGGESGVSIAQPIITGARRREAMEMAREEIRAAEAEFEDTRWRVLGDAHVTMIEALYWREALQLANGILREAEDTARLAKETNAPGRDAARAHARVAMQALEITRASAEGVYAAQRLQRAADMPRLTPEHLAGRLEEPRDPSLVQFSPGAVAFSHPAVIAATARVEAESARERMLHAELTPDVTVRAGASYDHRTEETLGAVGLSVPLHIWHRNQGMIAESQARIERLLRELMDVRLRLENELTELPQVISELETFHMDYDADVLPPLRRALAEVKAARRRGEADMNEVFTVESEWAAAERMRLEYVLGMKRAEARLHCLRGYVLIRMKGEG